MDGDSCTGVQINQTVSNFSGICDVRMYIWCQLIAFKDSTAISCNTAVLTIVPDIHLLLVIIHLLKLTVKSNSKFIGIVL